MTDSMHGGCEWAIACHGKNNCYLFSFNYCAPLLVVHTELRGDAKLVQFSYIIMSEINLKALSLLYVLYPVCLAGGMGLSLYQDIKCYEGYAGWRLYNMFNLPRESEWWRSCIIEEMVKLWELLYWWLSISLRSILLMKYWMVQLLHATCRRGRSWEQYKVTVPCN